MLLIGMIPAQDLYVEEGMPYEFTCGLNPSTPGGSTYTWKDISLLADGLLVDRSLIEKVDDMTVRYSVKKSAVAPQDYHIVQCSLDDMAIGLRYVYVGCKSSDRHFIVVDSSRQTGSWLHFNWQICRPMLATSSAQCIIGKGWCAPGNHLTIQCQQTMSCLTKSWIKHGKNYLGPNLKTFTTLIFIFIASRSIISRALCTELFHFFQFLLKRWSIKNVCKYFFMIYFSLLIVLYSQSVTLNFLLLFHCQPWIFCCTANLTIKLISASFPFA